MKTDCKHLRHVELKSRAPVQPSGSGCKECLEAGGDWVHLRLCLSCGHVGCCDDSPNRHATAHFHAEGHPVIRSYEPGEDWAYCYVDDQMTEIPWVGEEAARQHFFAPVHATR